MGESKTKPLAQRLDAVAESTTLKLNALVQSLIAKGEKVVNLTAGEPDFPAPDAAKAAVREALDRNASKYTPVPGIPELRECVARKTNAQQPSVKPWSQKDVVVSNGGKQALFDVALALLNPGDEVIIPAPYWLSYPDIVLLAGGVPKIVSTRFEDGFRMSPAQLRQALTPKTKAVIFNSPSNPTGSMYSREQFVALGKVLLDEPLAQGVWVISDEIYDRIILGDQPFVSFLECAPQLRDRSVTVNGLSKSGAMTGWRIGWSVAPQEMTQALIKIQGQSTSGINSLTQWAGVAALDLPESAFSAQVEAYRRRARLSLEVLSKSGKLRAYPPQGAFYVFVDVRGAMMKGEDDTVFAERLLQEAQVAVVPGSPFGAPEFVRLSFATDDRTLQEGCERFVRFVESRGKKTI